MKVSRISNANPAVIAACLGAALALLVWSPPARADDPRAEATAHQIAGTSLLEQGDAAGALREFEAAYALVPSPKIQFNMGLALQRLNRPVAALQAFDRFLDGAAAANAEIPRDKRDEAEAHRRELLSKLSAITITADLAGVTVAIDGVTQGKTPFAHPLYLEAGAHQLVARAPGAAPITQIFAATQGAALTIPLVLAPAGTAAAAPASAEASGAPRSTPAPVAAPRPPPIVALPPAAAAPPPAAPLGVSLSASAATEPAAWRRPVKWGAFGVAALGLGIGVFETVAAIGKSKDFNALPDNCMDDGNGHIYGGKHCEQVAHDQTVATWAAAAAYTLGGAAAITALVLQLGDAAAKPRESARAAGWVSCGADPSLTGVRCRARW